MEINSGNIENQNNFGIPASILKWIAIITMAIDHLAAGILNMGIIANENLLYVLTDDFVKLSTIMRGIGRISFPIFVFLLVESFYLTSNRKKMSIRLFLFALISEPFFDLCFNSKVLEFNSQNVYFTLLIGFLGMWVAEKIDSFIDEKIFGFLSKIMVFIIFMFVAEISHVDYGYIGVFAISVFYFLRGGSRFKRIIATVVSFAITTGYKLIAPVYLASIPLYLYNGKRGKQNKYLFYFFYPVHLLVIYLIRVTFC